MYHFNARVHVPSPRKFESALTFGSDNTYGKENHATPHETGFGDNDDGGETKSELIIADAWSDVRVHYHVDAHAIGHGHYGIVRKCMHRESGKWYAIKSIAKTKVSRTKVLKRETEILQELKHPHIIELVDLFEDEPYVHLITELCTGGELFDKIMEKNKSREGRFSERAAARMVQDLFDAIRYCHDVKGIVHRDLKPENFLFLTPDENSPLKIIDFGLSRHYNDNDFMKTKVGTAYYVAPEVLRQEYTKSCDIWSLGVITYIILCGFPPFVGATELKIFEAVSRGKFSFPSRYWDDISPLAKDFVSHLLKVDPRERPTAAEALKHPWFREQLGNEER